MAVINVKSEWSQAKAPISRGGGSSPTLSWSVLLNGDDPPETAAIIARQAPGIPRIGQRHPGDPFAFARQVSPKPISPTLFRVTVQYQTPSGTSRDGESTNPLDEPPGISWSFEQFMQQLDTDLAGNAIVNSAGDPFEPRIEVPISRPVLSYTRNEAAFRSGLAREFLGGVSGRSAINSDCFFGWEPKTVKIRNMSATRQYAGDFSFDQVSYEFVFDGANWDASPLDVGYRERRGDELVLIRDPQGQPVTDPANLTDKGTAALPTAALRRAGPFRIFPLKAFARLGITY